ncbi:MAG: transglycosylase domain-containing protein [Phascolarctobacterium sp.]|nr:transglycosylase domain-containing protein [Phascolarctobacterium sp.]
MFKILLMAALIFAGMAAYDSVKPEQPAKPPAAQEQSEQTQMDKTERKVMMNIFLSFLPDRSEWPEHFQKAFEAFNMEDVIDPIRDGQDYVKLENIHIDMQHAIIAIEDHDFYQHGPIAIDSIVRAIMVNISEGNVVQGGSTITQQLVKNIFLSNEQSLGRKLEEACFSLIIEHYYSKDDILELYLNTTYFGAGAKGITQAAEIYFDKTPQTLTLPEAAVLAAMPYAPSALNPFENPGGCKKRQILVLSAMQKYGFLSQKQAEEAKVENVKLADGTELSPMLPVSVAL